MQKVSDISLFIQSGHTTSRTLVYKYVCLNTTISLNSRLGFTAFYSPKESQQLDLFKRLVKQRVFLIHELLRTPHHPRHRREQTNRQPRLAPRHHDLVTWTPQSSVAPCLTATFVKPRPYQKVKETCSVGKSTR